MTAALETFGLGKSYGRGERAVSALGALDLSIPNGLVYGVLGPNGAGKSTLLRLALGLVRPGRGSVRLLGEQTTDARVLRRVGAMIEAPSLYPFLTARDHAGFRPAVRLHGAGARGSRARTRRTGGSGRPQGAHLFNGHAPAPLPRRRATHPP